MKAIKDLLQRIRTDREKKQGTWIGVDESHIILNALEKSERIETENAELRARLDKAIELPPGDRVWYIAEDEEGQESYIISKPTNSLTVEELKYAMDKKYFSTREEAAESRAKRDKAIELPCKIGETIYTIIKNCAWCQHYNVRWAECNAPATANFDCKSIHEICFTQDIIDDECKKHLFVAEMKFDLALLDSKTGKLLPCYFTDREAAEARLKELKENAEDPARVNRAGELPCKVGDTLYEPFIDRIREWIVDSIYVFSLGINVNCERKDDCRWHDHFAIREKHNDFEGRVYLTREAAEARLKELQEREGK